MYVSLWQPKKVITATDGHEQNLQRVSVRSWLHVSSPLTADTQRALCPLHIPLL
jgi:hypothetical protein